MQVRCRRSRYCKAGFKISKSSCVLASRATTSTIFPDRQTLRRKEPSSGRKAHFREPKRLRSNIGPATTPVCYLDQQVIRYRLASSIDTTSVVQEASFDTHHLKNNDQHHRFRPRSSIPARARLARPRQSRRQDLRHHQRSIRSRGETRGIPRMLDPRVSGMDMARPPLLST